MLGMTLSQYCPTDSAMSAEQNKIENELLEFEKNIFGDQAKKDSLDSLANAQEDVKAVKKHRRSRRGSTTSARSSRRTRQNNGNSNNAARVTVRRQRH